LTKSNELLDVLFASYGRGPVPFAKRSTELLGGTIVWNDSHHNGIEGHRETKFWIVWQVPPPIVVYDDAATATAAAVIVAHRHPPQDHSTSIFTDNMTNDNTRRVAAKG
jgi:hypothetical protein